MENIGRINQRPLDMQKGTEHGDAESVCWRVGHRCGHSWPKVRRRQESERLKAERWEMPLLKLWLSAEDLRLQMSKPALANIGRIS